MKWKAAYPISVFGKLECFALSVTRLRLSNLRLLLKLQRLRTNSAVTMIRVRTTVSGTETDTATVESFSLPVSESVFNRQRGRLPVPVIVDGFVVVPELILFATGSVGDGDDNEMSVDAIVSFLAH